MYEAMISRYTPGRIAGRDYVSATDSDVDASAVLAFQIESLERQGAPRRAQGTARRGRKLARHVRSVAASASVKRNCAFQLRGPDTLRDLTWLPNWSGQCSRMTLRCLFPCVRSQR